MKIVRNVVSLELRNDEIVVITRGNPSRSCSFKEIDKVLVDKDPQFMELHTKRGESVEFRFLGARDWGLAIGSRMKCTGLAGFAGFHQPREERAAKRKTTCLVMLALYAICFTAGLFLVFINWATCIVGLVVVGVSPVLLIPTFMNGSEKPWVRNLPFLGFVTAGFPLLLGIPGVWSLVSSPTLGFIIFQLIIIVPLSTTIVLVLVMIRFTSISWLGNPSKVVRKYRVAISSNWEGAFDEARVASVDTIAVVPPPASILHLAMDIARVDDEGGLDGHKRPSTSPGAVCGAGVGISIGAPIVITLITRNPYSGMMWGGMALLGLLVLFLILAIARGVAVQPYKIRKILRELTLMRVSGKITIADLKEKYKRPRRFIISTLLRGSSMGFFIDGRFNGDMTEFYFTGVRLPHDTYEAINGFRP